MSIFQPGKLTQPQAAKLDAMAAQTDALSRLKVSGGLTLTRGVGGQVVIGRGESDSAPYYLRIGTRSGTHYAHVEVKYADGEPGTWPVLPGGVSGTVSPNVNAAVELNLSTAVPSGAVVEAWDNPYGPGFLFAYGAPAPADDRPLSLPLGGCCVNGVWVERFWDSPTLKQTGKVAYRYVAGGSPAWQVVPGISDACPAGYAAPAPTDAGSCWELRFVPCVATSPPPVPPSPPSPPPPPPGVKYVCTPSGCVAWDGTGTPPAGWDGAGPYNSLAACQAACKQQDVTGGPQ